jgi:hypothetical protein
MWRWDGGQAQAAPQRSMSDLFARPSVVELPSVLPVGRCQVRAGVLAGPPIPRSL